MTTISADVIADSISPSGKRITTLQLRYPRWIHAEGRTHRQQRIAEDEFDWEPRTPSLMEDENLSRNASSSRAIPVPRLIDDVLADPAIPLFWGKNQKGMQADEECAAKVSIGYDNIGPVEYTREQGWTEARNRAIHVARAYHEAGYHKQIVNRLLEPFSHINVVVTATEWDNFFGLRRHADAEPHIRLLADRMWEAMQASDPALLGVGQWHLPYIHETHNLDWDDRITTLNAIKVSVARCARVSYLTHDGRASSIEEDLSLYERLVGSQPIHASPAEHQATPDYRHTTFGWRRKHRWGNFKAWVQYRKTLPGECIFNHANQ